ncbi:MAG: class I SAM-dependent RNA methyltransferase [Oscillospiraceae bacterium]|jgi:putative N6-adenine-specific DNA methylase|nr:class I SAM-dependent RNA methyltransferase [Oscillospiraceae bacterium]
MTLTVPCLFGLEGLLADELKRLGFAAVEAVDGRVNFTADNLAAAVARANINLRTGERVLIRLAEFKATTFEELFQGVKAIDWETYIPRGGAFPVTGRCVKSKLMSIPDCQKIIKKASATRLGEAYGITRMPEDGITYPVRFNIMSDTVRVYLDTSGAALHKRGYRPDTPVEAPLRETLAAAIVQLSRYRGRGTLIDAFCGSGTLAIEAALNARNIAPGQGRKYVGEAFHFLSRDVWQSERDNAKAREFTGDYHIIASDLDSAALANARANAERAGVADIIRFETADARTRDYPGDAIILANPPYGERLSTTSEAAKLYKALGEILRDKPLYLLTADLDFERDFGAKAKKRRKLYNGMLQCMLYMYF